MTRKRPQTSIFIYKVRLTFIVSLLCAIFCAVLGRLYYLHIERSEESIEEASKAEAFRQNPASEETSLTQKTSFWRQASGNPVGADPSACPRRDVSESESWPKSQNGLRRSAFGMHALSGRRKNRTNQSPPDGTAGQAHTHNRHKSQYDIRRNYPQMRNDAEHGNNRRTTRRTSSAKAESVQGIVASARH